MSLTRQKLLTPILIVGSFLLCITVTSAATPNDQMAAAPAEQMVNPKLAKRMEIYEPSLQKVGDRVHAVIGYAYSNYAYIEGDDGIIVVDSGWFPGQAERSIAAYRKTISDKPIAAIIYTHSHLDHTGGASAIMQGQNKDIPVYGAKGFHRWVDDSFSHLGHVFFKRAFMQMGIVLPRGETGTVGNGLNPSPKVEGKPELSFPPTITVDKPMDVNIAGVRMQIMPVQGDIPENLYVWLPDDEILFVGDIPLHATFPALETVRFEPERDPRELVVSLKKIQELDPEFVVPGHGRVLYGKDDVRDVTIANMDTVEFMVDQVDRYYINGYSADEIVDQMKLPPKLAAHPDLQPFYHRVEWMIKTMYFKRAGFVGESMDYVTLTGSEESKRLVPLLGGVEAVHTQAQEALDADDPRWAARLATYAMKVDANDQTAKQIRQAAFTRIARTTESANERNYLFSIIREENGELDWKKLLSNIKYEAMQKQNTDTVIAMMKSRFMAEDADGLENRIKVSVTGEAPRLMSVRNNVLRVGEFSGGKVDGALTLERDTLNKIAANMTTWSEAFEAGDIKAEKGSDSIKRLVDLIE